MGSNPGGEGGKTCLGVELELHHAAGRSDDVVRREGQVSRLVGDLDDLHVHILSDGAADQEGGGEGGEEKHGHCEGLGGAASAHGMINWQEKKRGKATETDAKERDVGKKKIVFGMVLETATLAGVYNCPHDGRASALP
jgi:hypothetical protein